LPARVFPPAQGSEDAAGRVEQGAQADGETTQVRTKHKVKEFLLE